MNKLLVALNECTEWGHIFCLHCLSNYNPKDDREAQSICEWVTAAYLIQLSSGAFSSKSPNKTSRVVTQQLCLLPSETRGLVQQVLSVVIQVSGHSELRDIYRWLLSMNPIRTKEVVLSDL